MRVGEVVGSYRITGKLGSGGMGAVYLAKHTLIGREAAIKVLLPELCGDESIVARFFNEARTTTAIKHPGIVEIYDFGYARDGSAYLVMERLEGEPLGARLKRINKVPLEQALSIARQMTGALMAAHRIGIVHRDLKPDNVYIVSDPEVAGGERAKILDFGIAKLRDKGDGFSAFQTQEGTVMGAPTYMAPEQVAGADKVDHRADQYSVGCILFEMLCGRPPFEGRAYGEVMAKQVREPPPRPSSINPSIPPQIDALLLRMLEKRPDARFADAYDLLQRLHELSGLPPPSFAGPLVVPTPPPSSEEMGSPFESQGSVDPVDGGPMNITRSAVVSSARLTLALGPRSRGSQPPPFPPLQPVGDRSPPPPPPSQGRPGGLPDELADTMPSPVPKPPPPGTGAPPMFAVPSVIPPTMPRAVQQPPPNLPPPPPMGPHGMVPPIPADAPTMYDQPRPPPIDLSPMPPMAHVREPSTLSAAAGAPMMLQDVAPRRSGKLGALVVGIAIAAGGASAYFIATSDDLAESAAKEEAARAAPSEPAKTAAAAAGQPKVEDTQPTVVVASDAAPGGAATQPGGEKAASTPPDPAAKDSAEPPDDEETNRRPAALVTLRIDSLPRGAQVIRKADNVRLGETPFTYQTEPQAGSVTFVLRHKGYRDEVVTVPSNRSVDRKIPLTRSSGSDRAPSIHDP